jgi:effector-binding domain-containing protein
VTEYTVRLETASARPLAVARATTGAANLGNTIIQLLDKVWPVLREQQVPTGHNVVVYLDGLMRIEAGVEVFGSFAPTGDVYASATPAGEVVTTSHWGEYTAVSAAYAALEQWYADNSRRPGGPSWEVYGDWSDDPRLQRMDIYQLLG